MFLWSVESSRHPPVCRLSICEACPFVDNARAPTAPHPPPSPSTHSLRVFPQRSAPPLGFHASSAFAKLGPSNLFISHEDEIQQQADDSLFLVSSSSGDALGSEGDLEFEIYKSLSPCPARVRGVKSHIILELWASLFLANPYILPTTSQGSFSSNPQPAGISVGLGESG